MTELKKYQKKQTDIEKNFRCNFCDFKYTSKAELNRHRSRVHHYLKQQMISAKRMRLHATMACYTFFERSWHAKCQSMSKWVTPLMAVMQLAKNTQLNSSMAPKEPYRQSKWADVSPLSK